MKSKAEIVIETLKFYNKNNRGYNAEEEYCTYYDEATGNKCAVGRCIDDSAIKGVSDTEQDYIKTTECSPSVDLLSTFCKGIDNVLKPEYRGHDIDFWGNLQYLHDSSHLWNEDGFDHNNGMSYILSAFGKEIATAVKEAFAKDTNIDIVEKTA